MNIRWHDVSKAAVCVFSIFALVYIMHACATNYNNTSHVSAATSAATACCLHMNAPKYTSIRAGCVRDVRIMQVSSGILWFSCDVYMACMLRGVYADWCMWAAFCCIKRSHITSSLRYVCSLHVHALPIGLLCNITVLNYYITCGIDAYTYKSIHTMHICSFASLLHHLHAFP